ncbi:hypothetical protein [Scleromatobacter humisilvae]|uniref:Uncharacterized protein n=1 Tax=Scleromatobacter humisilvae TaxID=2897159 RepID=A0A9X1YFL9_9BURK|nr:hypothetical protein [Scleromatobacter humisilvae]MCK9684570.1 hypothetical protein [Scleromatobacter humisilvae]
MKRHACLFALALAATSVNALAMPPDGHAAAASAASAASAAASSACPGRPAPSLATHRVTSKARHTIDDADPCADPHSPPAQH